MNESLAKDQSPLWTIVRRYGLTHREEDVLLMLLRGVHMKEMASLLGCSYSTVRTHVQHAARKLNCSGTSQMLARVARDVASADGNP